jgi:hypothetical protein
MVAFWVILGIAAAFYAFLELRQPFGATRLRATRRS